MIELRQLDPHVSIQDQAQDSSPGPVVLVNVFHVVPEQADALVAAWTADATYFKSRAGYICTQLHRGIAGSGTFLNYAVWESVAAFRAAFSAPEFRSRLAGYPDGAVGSPHLMRKLAVEGICVA